MISFIICANSKWQDYATGFVNSLLLYEEGVEIVLVDNGSPKPYPPSPDYHLIRLNPGEQYNYMAALNAGAEVARGDWLAFCNDDIVCTGPFSSQIHSLDWRNLYGMEIRCKDASWGLDFCYIYGWIILVHRKVWEAVGPFDEYYLHAGFDDLDYSWRCQQVGFGIEQARLPFVHLADISGNSHRRMSVPGYRDSMTRSKAHFLEKVHATQDLPIFQSPK